MAAALFGLFISVLNFVNLSTALVVGITAGSYPAFYISGFRPALILVKRQSGTSGQALMRKGLVVLQFVLPRGIFYNYVENQPCRNSVHYGPPGKGVEYIQP